MTTAIIGIGNIGGTLARELASGGEAVVLSSTSPDAVRRLATEIGTPATAARSNRDAVQQADTVILALWLGPMRTVIEEVVDLLPGELVIDTSNPISIAADGTVSRTLPDDQSAGEVVARWLPQGTRFAKAFGTVTAPLLSSGAHRTPEPAVLLYTTDDDRAATEVERLIWAAGFAPMRLGGVHASGRIEVGGGLHSWGGLNGRLVDREEAASLIASSKNTVV
jgi:8-hydroxy-5-deazaflavin:NADPH oxidoreductase